ncbi:putative NAD(P)/FAD-binding protein YdhS [Allocatelliglobosispora scoriae]|uniref:Putative NAD(P)/FAD-binding protein YdhS n=1 Tax=Allocatelliglobosispora scoriae TaxID=643052 RepID=A0A841C256_9ACTN|nr:FAD/NAD(P)-binding protein [Allocatelliglobosispora scoriae]MBB5874434.1 putative NAD(P)/FAD-binding protein YdhS [Allocatelliglobosispora scoriae]
MNGTRVVVVGGGCSGVLATRELLDAGFHVTLIDPAAQPGRGIAYGAAAPWHLLNSPVGAMSADPDQPDDFLQWCRVRNRATAPTDFVPRTWYGDYLAHVLRKADSDRLAVYRGRVARIGVTSGDTLALVLSDGVVMPADQIVLALGHPQPATPAYVDLDARDSGRYIADPWQPDALSGLGDGPLLLIGTGLTAVDVATTLVNNGTTAPVTMLSRHGLLPQSHRRPGEGPMPVQISPAELAAAGSAGRMLRILRDRAETTGDWRAVMDALRHHWDELWAALDDTERSRFLRHLARYWEVHRHRMPAPVADEIDRLRLAGRLQICAGELRRVGAPSAEGLQVTARYRDGGVHVRDYAAVVNCTGPGSLLTADPLVGSLLDAGLARPGSQRLGLDVDSSGALIRQDGTVNPAIWTLGPPRRGTLWETTAAPEIRTQARALAQRLTAAQA